MEIAIKQVMKSVVELPVKDIIVPEPTLEEIFLYFYKGRQND